MSSRHKSNRTSRRVISLAFIVTTLCVTVAALLARPKEPCYEGYPLNNWVRVLSNMNLPTFGPGCNADNAPEAIRQMGTNSLPWLVKWLSYKGGPTPVRNAVNWSIGKFPPLEMIKGLQDWAWFDTKNVRGEGAYLAFQILGPTGTPAIPDLLKVALKPGKIVPQYRAVDALAGIGPSALPALLTIVTNETVEGMVRYSAAVGIGRLGTNAATAIPHLLMALRSTDTCAAAGAAEALGAIRLEAYRVVPALADAALHPGGMHERDAMSALGKFGPTAVDALPALWKIAGQGDRINSQCAMSAIVRIRQTTNVLSR